MMLYHVLRRRIRTVAILGTAFFFFPFPGCASATSLPPAAPHAQERDSPVSTLPPTGSALPSFEPSEFLALPMDYEIPDYAAPLTLPPARAAVTEPVPAEPMPKEPARGVTNLIELAHSAAPARRASLSLTQDARLSYMNQEAAGARHRLESALQLWGRNPYALYYLGLLELGERNYAAARDYASAAIDNTEDARGWRARFYLLLAEAEDRLGNAREAGIARHRAFALDSHAVLR